MIWTYEWDGDDAVIYDHTDEEVTRAEHDPMERGNPHRDSSGTPVNPDVRGAICDYVCDEIEAEDWPSEDAKETYIRTAQTVLAAGRIEERE